MHGPTLRGLTWFQHVVTGTEETLNGHSGGRTGHGGFALAPGVLFDKLEQCLKYHAGAGHMEVARDHAKGLPPPRHCMHSCCKVSVPNRIV